MNVKFLLIAIASVSLGSCSTAYRSGQTPDDVYYSPVRVVEEKNDRYEERRDHRADAEEREIRMASRDRRWRDWDNDYDCRYDPYRYGYTYGYYYNPYYYPYPVYSGYTYVNPKNNTPRMGNLAGYNPKTMVISDPKTGTTKWNNAPRVNNNNGGFVRRILTPAADRSSTPVNNNRSYNPSPGGSSGSSGSRSSGAPVSRPARGN